MGSCRLSGLRLKALLSNWLAWIRQRHRLSAEVEELLLAISEIDLVSHSGNAAEGEFAYSLNLTDIHSGWAESRALLGKSQGKPPGRKNLQASGF